MKKPILAIMISAIITTVLFVGLTPILVSGGCHATSEKIDSYSTEKNFIFSINTEKGGYTVSLNKNEPIPNIVNIPSSYKGLPVTCINDYGFQYGIIEEITIPDTITKIGVFAFDECTNLSKVNYMGTIDQWAQINFGNLYSNPSMYANDLYVNDELVTNIYLNCNVSPFAFHSLKSLKTVNFLYEAREIGYLSFYNCMNLTSFSIGTNVHTIGSGALEDCVSLTYINIPYCVTYLDYGVFAGCTNLDSIDFKNPYGWRTASEADDYGEPIDVSTSSLNARYFTQTYADNRWWVE